MRDEASLVPGLKAVRAFLRDPAFDTASRLWVALIPLFPEGVIVGDAARHLSIPESDAVHALALLDSAGMVEFSDIGGKRAVRIDPGQALLLKQGGGS